MKRLWLHIFVLFLVGSTLGCSQEEGGLRGSLGDFYDLTYSEVRARLYASELSIEYVRENGQVPVRITLMTGDEALAAGEYNLGDDGRITGRAGDNDIPRFLAGTLDLEEFSPANGSAIKGSFSARFETGQDEASLSGDFETELEVVDQIIGYDADLSYLYDAGDADM